MNIFGNPIKTFQNAVKKREYNGVIKSLDEICIKKLGYEEIKQCNPKGELNIEIDGFKISPRGVEKLPRKTFNLHFGEKCKHYAQRNNGELTEGIAYRAIFGGERLFEFELVGYGNVFKGELVLAQKCFDCEKPEERLSLKSSMVKKITPEEIERICKK